MKKVVFVLCMGIVGLVILTIGGWYAFLATSFPDTYRQQRQEFTARDRQIFEEHQKYPKDQNLATVMAPLLGKELNVLQGPKGPVRTSDLELFSAYYENPGTPMEMQARGTMADPQFAKAVADFSRVEALLDSWKKYPHFYWPSTGGDYEKRGADSIPNIARIRELARGQAMVSYYYWLQLKQPKAALQRFLEQCNDWERFGGQHEQGYDSVAMALYRTSLDGIAEMLAKAELSREDYQLVLDGLNQSMYDKQYYQDFVDGAFADEINMAHILYSGLSDEVFGSESGLLEKIKAYINGQIGLRTVSNRFFINEKVYRNPEYTGKYTTEQHSWLRGIHYYNMTITQIEGMKLLCALQQYRLANKKWPSSLDEVKSSFGGEFPHNYCTENGLFEYAAEGKQMSLIAEDSFLKKQIVLYPQFVIIDK